MYSSMTPGSNRVARPILTYASLPPHTRCFTVRNDTAGSCAVRSVVSRRPRRAAISPTARLFSARARGLPTPVDVWVAEIVVSEWLSSGLGSHSLDGPQLVPVRRAATVAGARYDRSTLNTLGLVGEDRTGPPG